MSLLNSLGAVAVGILCILVLLGIFGLFPLPYLFSSMILKFKARSYWRAFGMSLLSILGTAGIGALIYWLVGKSANAEVTQVVALIAIPILHLFIVSLLSLWIFEISWKKGVLLWLLALPMNLIVIGLYYLFIKL